MSGMKGLVTLVGLAAASVAVALLWRWPAGLLAFGIGLYIDQWLPHERRRR